MNSRQTVSLPEFSRGQWADEPLQPPPHPAELNLAARVRSGLGKLASLATVRSWLRELASLTRVRSWMSELTSLIKLTPLTFARYLIAFFVGVVATVAWQSYRGGTKEETAAATSAALDLVRQSVDKLAAEVTKIRAVEQNILERIPASPPQPVATPARSPAQRPSPGR